MKDFFKDPNMIFILIMLVVVGLFIVGYKFLTSTPYDSVVAKAETTQIVSKNGQQALFSLADKKIVDFGAYETLKYAGENVIAKKGANYALLSPDGKLILSGLASEPALVKDGSDSCWIAGGTVYSFDGSAKLAEGFDPGSVNIANAYIIASKSVKFGIYGLHAGKEIVAFDKDAVGRLADGVFYTQTGKEFWVINGEGKIVNKTAFSEAPKLAGDFVVGKLDKKKEAKLSLKEIAAAK